MRTHAIDCDLDEDCCCDFDADLLPPPLVWNDPQLEACEQAPCPCGHIAFDHDWYRCEDCDCKRSHIHALLASGRIAVVSQTGAA